jgi:S1-C subfamily serine protease
MVAVSLALGAGGSGARAADAPPADSAAADARRIAGAFSSVAARVEPSVAQIEVAVRDESSAVIRWYKGSPTLEAAIRRGLGSGVVISAEGHILTNNHVIEGALAINVRLADGRLLAASVVGRDPATDLAMLKVAATKLQPARFADSDQTRVGEWVMAIGSPFGLGHTVTMGVLSAKGRGGLGMNAVEDYLQTDASINPGNSGGPLVNLDGAVIGVNVMIVGRAQGIGFAVPSKMARRIAEQLVRTGRVQRAWVGVGVQDLSPEIAAELRIDAGSGALVNQVVPGAPAERARLQPGDIVTSVGGKPVRDAQEFLREVLGRDVGETVRLEVLRAGRRYSTDVALVARSESPPPPLPMQQPVPPSASLGLSLRDVPLGARERPDAPQPSAAQIADVALGSPADRAGLRAGDLVLQADGVARPSAAQVVKATEDGHALLLVQRGQGTFFAGVHR